MYFYKIFLFWYSMDRVNYFVSKVDFGKIFECFCCKFLSVYVYKIKVKEKY